MKGKDVWMLFVVFIVILAVLIFLFVRIVAINFSFGNVLYVKIHTNIDDEKIPELAQWVYETVEKDKGNRIKAVFVDINSPGGSAASSEEMYQALQYAKKKGKKVIAYIHSIGASGGYYIASAADKIVANPTALTGSIGAIIIVPDIVDLSNKLGIKWDIYKSGENKDLTQPFRKRTEKDSILLTELSKDIWKVFLERVAKSRGKKPEDLLPIADGRVLTAPEALKWGLVDTLGTRYDALEILKKEAKVKKIRFIEKREKKRFLQRLLEGEEVFNIKEYLMPRVYF
ncbi:MAG: signal peptide peptidase SppA [candidate division WOR-3 bacterium]